MATVKKVGIDGNRIVTEIDGVVSSVPAGDRPLERIAHVALAHLEGDEAVAFKELMQLGLGCRCVTVMKNELETLEIDDQFSNDDV